MKTQAELNEDTIFAFQMAMKGHKQFEWYDPTRRNRLRKGSGAMSTCQKCGQESNGMPFHTCAGMSLAEQATQVLKSITGRIEYGKCTEEELRAMRCLKTAIEGLLRIELHTSASEVDALINREAQHDLTTLINQWNSK